LAIQIGFYKIVWLSILYLLSFQITFFSNKSGMFVYQTLIVVLIAFLGKLCQSQDAQDQEYRTVAYYTNW
jgi:hypothetical protein